MKKWIMGGLILIGLLILVKTDIILPLDNMIYEYVSQLQTPTLTTIILKITDLGSAIFYGIICVGLMFYNRKLGLLLTLNTSLGFIMNYTLKNIVQRPRPIERLAIETGYSFPSSHATCAVMFYGLIGILIANSNLKYRKQLSIISWTFIPIIAFTRVYLHVHYFSDVIAGMIFGGIILSIVYQKFLKNILGKQEGGDGFVKEKV